MGSRRVPRRRGRRGGRTPPAGQATSCGAPGAARGGVASGVRRALPVQRTRPSTAQRSRSLRPGRAAPRCRLPVPGTRRGGGTQRARPRAGRAPRAEPPPGLGRAAEREPNCLGVRVCASPSRLPSLALRGDGPSSGLRAGAFCGRGSYLHTNCLALAGRSAWARARSVVSQITVLPCTCLADYLWESVGGAERVENAASLRQRKKTLSPGGGPLPRVSRRDTRASTASGFNFAPLSSKEEEDT